MKQKKKEIGSEFWVDENNLNNSDIKFNPLNYNFYGDIQYVLSGRTALDLICQDIISLKGGNLSVYMPLYSCESMSVPFINRGIKIEYYDIEYKGNKLNHILLKENVDILYISNYFGFIGQEDIEYIKFQKSRGTIILYDRTHSLLIDDQNMCILSDYIFSSLRKWGMLPTGAVVSKSCGTFISIKLQECPYANKKFQGMLLKSSYICGQSNVTKECFFRFFNEFNSKLYNDYCEYQIDENSLRILHNMDFEKIKEIRKRNARIIYNGLKNINEVKFMFELSDNSVPLFIPILVDKTHRDKLKSYLCSFDVYCPTHWPKHSSVKLSDKSNYLFESEISLICDQRYDDNDMNFIVNIIKKYFRQ